MNKQPWEAWPVPDYIAPDEETKRTDTFGRTDFNQAMAVVLIRGGNSPSRWVAACDELDSLVRRWGFEIVSQTAGSLTADTTARTYQVLGERGQGIGEHIDQIKVEVRHITYLYRLPNAKVVFGSIQTIDGWS